MNPISNCRDGTERLMEYMDGALDEALRRTIDEHVAGCARCQAFVKSYASVPSIMREATGATLTPSGLDALRQVLAGRQR